MPDSPPSVGLGEVARLFLKLGAIAFGGPAAHVAMLEDEVVRRRGWLSREDFLDLWAATHLIPGPNSTELAIHIGHRVAGWPGLLVAGACFILPAFLIVWGLAWAYVAFGAMPQAEALLSGVKPVVLAVVLQALWGLGKTALKTKTLAAVALAVAGGLILGAHELALLLAAGAAVAALRGFPARGAGLAFAPWLAATASGSAPVGLWPIFGFFVKVGSVLFGSGYVLLAFLQTDLVDRWGWLTSRQLLDAVAIGQVTPGPVFTTATFIGYLLAGTPGAVTATVGIFLPAFVFVALSGPLVPRMRRSPVAAAFLDGVVAASLALMAVVSWDLARAAIVDGWTAAIGVGAAIALIRYRVNSAWLVLAGAVIGLLLGIIRSS